MIRVIRVNSGYSVLRVIIESVVGFLGLLDSSLSNTKSGLGKERDPRIVISTTSPTTPTSTADACCCESNVRLVS